MANDLQSAARQESESMLKVLKRIAKRSTAKDSDRIAAAREVLDRGHGKPITPILAATPQDALALLNYSDEELLKVVAAPARHMGEPPAALPIPNAVGEPKTALLPQRTRRGNLFTVADSEPAPSLEVDEDDLAG